jgi:Kef-type K+ transport system membrane component KefB
MKTILSLVLLLVIAFAASRVLNLRARSRTLNVLYLSGIEFFFVGVLLGPEFLDVISANVIKDLTPIVYLALGWAGLLFGSQLSWQHLQRVTARSYRLIILDGAVIILICGAVFLVMLRVAYPETGSAARNSCAATMALAAAISSPTLLIVLSRMLPSRGRFTNICKVTTSLSGVLPLVLLGLISTIAHPRFLATDGLASGALWWVFANGLGIVMGFVFVLLTARKAPREERLLLIMGTVILLGGLCYFLKLSALYTSMIMGVIVGNFSRRRVQIVEQLITVEKTIYVAFLIVIGATVSLSGRGLFAVTAGYVLVRALLRLTVSSWAIGRVFPEVGPLGRFPGLVYTAQGGLAMAVALDYGLGVPDEIVQTVVAVIALGVVVNEMLGAYLTRVALAASGEIGSGRPERLGKDVLRD